MGDNWTAGDVAHVLINPAYAVSISPALVGTHEPLVSKADWVAANKRLIQELGVDVWLDKLLQVLEDDFPRNPDDGDVLLGYKHP